MNLRIVGKYIGYLLLLEAACMLPSVLVGAIYGERRPMLSLLAAAGLCLLVGAALALACKKQTSGLYAREGFVVAGGGWLLISAFGALPFVISGEIPNYIDALFEAVSGFTTTGASILLHVDEMSYSLIFWRSFTHWLGGVGVLAFLLLIVRAQKGAGFTMHLLRAETAGPQVGKLMPRMQESLRALYIVYLSLSAVNLALLLAGGMPLFDALCTMFGTAGTGGFGIRPDSMASYSPYLQTVTTVFMALFGVNFALYFLLWRREWRAVLRDEELRLYIGILLGSTALITLNILPGFASVKEALHHAAFSVSSVMTTTGFSSVDFDLWPVFSRVILLMLMFVGAMAGSTGGGVKVSRLLILLKSVRVGLHRLLRPRSVKAVKINGKTLEAEAVNNVYFFIIVYIFLFFTSFLLISLDGFSIETNFSAVTACLNNIGPGFGDVGPSYTFDGYSMFSKLVLTINMLLGRLEIFPILLLAMPATWRQKS